MATRNGSAQWKGDLRTGGVQQISLSATLTS
jgi:hypothetical protein